MRKFSYLGVVLAVVVLGVATVFNNCSSFNSSDSVSSGAGNVAPQSILGNALPLSLGQANVIPIVFSTVLTNIPTVSVTVCTPGTSNCQTISNVLLDTGSTGLRLYTQAFSVPLNPLLATSGIQYGECYQFGSAVSYWGAVVTADVTLGGEKISGMNIQAIDSTFKTVPTDCSENGTFEVSDGPQFDGYNGILGLQPFALDCGANCVPDTVAAIYYTCPSGSSTCTGVTMPENLQVPNPVARMSGDANGYAIQLPTVATGGATALPGSYLVFGIGTRSNNIPSGARAIPVDQYGMFVTIFDGQALPYSFIDSGSDDLTFPTPSASTIPSCTFTESSQSTQEITMFCPATPQEFSAIIAPDIGSPQLTLDFQLMNGETAWLAPANTIFSNIGEPIDDGSLSGNGSTVNQTFDWGLPVFFGKTIYFGMENMSVSGLGEGPFNAM